MTATPPTIRVPQLTEALSVAALDGLRGDVLLAYLRAQRWFGAKGSATDARFVDVIPLPWDSPRLAIGIVEVRTGHPEPVVAGAPQDRLREGSAVLSYQLPLSVRRVDAAVVGASSPTAVIASLSGPDGEASLLDATLDPVFQKALGAAFANGASFEGPTRTGWTIEPTGKAGMKFGPDPEVTVGSVEQSNTALIYDRQAFLKLFRRVESGVHPDVEMTRFLTLDAGFPHVPTLFGTVSYRSPGGEAIAGMMQEYLAGSRDAWSYVLESADPKKPSRTMIADLEQLGRTTREMHDALSGDAADNNPDFTPVAVGEADVERWAQKTKEMIREALGLLEKQLKAGKVARERAAEVEALIRRKEHYLTWSEEVADLVGADAGARIRVHGDYHLGQVLRTKSDKFVVIDFEGEPTRPLAERREKNSPLKDVAGMLRSIAYAAATLVQPDPREKLDRRQIAERELIGGRWERDARAAFLRGYTGVSVDTRGLFPSDSKRFEALLALFEGEKAFYELAYELNHRPGWEWIPMRGISHLMSRLPHDMQQKG